MSIDYFSYSLLLDLMYINEHIIITIVFVTNAKLMNKFNVMESSH